jgi:hypothetical protein
MFNLKQYTALLFAYLWVALAGSALAADAPVPAADFAPVIAYFPVVAEGAQDAPPMLVPVASNHPLDGDHKGLTRAILAVHDASRDSGDVLSALMALAGPSNATAMIVAPQFLIESDLALFSERLPDHGRSFARWPLGQWEQGGDSAVASGQKGVSAFTAADILLFYLGERKFFPDLKEIVIAGQGAGADFVLRYAAAGRAADILEADGIPVRFVAANASSYLYPTPSRPQSGKPGFAVPDATACPRFDAWPYGLEHLNAYAGKTGANAIKLKAATRNVTYLVSVPSPGDAGADGSCAALLQGRDAATRALNYSIYLSLMYGDARQSQVFAPLVKGGGAIALFGSPCGMAQLFGSGACTDANPTTVKNPR